VVSGAVVTAALFANLGGGVNVGDGSSYSAVAIPSPDEETVATIKG
jgi:hypothetical protein